MNCSHCAAHTELHTLSCTLPGLPVFNCSSRILLPAHLFGCLVKEAPDKADLCMAILSLTTTVNTAHWGFTLYIKAEFTTKLTGLHTRPATCMPQVPYFQQWVGCPARSTNSALFPHYAQADPSQRTLNNIHINSLFIHDINIDYLSTCNVLYNFL